ncbi:MAG: hypothetical protein DMG57_13870 [Acidobacteria bacterium]|nr:MAG: hypothetical protein DMG57_13870 [Acidobacteriota bacterium]
MNALGELTSQVAVPEPQSPKRLSWVRVPARTRVLLISAAVLIPCFWHSRIQAGDLSSHLYNAWLADLIGQGKAPGLAIVSQRTNVLFDWIIAALIKHLGVAAAEHIAVPLVVLVFFWGAFAMVSSMSGTRPWYILTFLAMLSYGWVFHMGFMNFYLALGLCFWAVALLWKPTWSSGAGAVLLLGTAWLAHALPVAWAVGALAYMWIARRILPRDRIFLLLFTLVALVFGRHFILTHLATRWSADQAVSMTGADQISVFSSKYYPLEVILLGVWLSLFLGLLDKEGEEQVLCGIPFQLCAILAACVLLLPGSVLLPGHDHALRFVSERMSLIVAVTVCVLLGRTAPVAHEKTTIAVLMGLFFSFLYVDTRALNHVEDLMEQSVAQLPPNARVVSALCDERKYVNLVGHTLDRVCIGRCYSYANHEPPSGAFRIRTTAPNPVVAAEQRDSDALQEGTYVVKPGDEPIYQLYLRGNYLDMRQLKAGDVTGSTCFESTPSPGSAFHVRIPGSN